MQKIKYILPLAIAVVLYWGCTQKAQIAGPAGASGTTGVAGGNLVYAIKYATLTSTNMQGSGALYHQSIWYPYYNKNVTYMISGYATKVPLVDTIRYPEWYKMPYTNVYTTTADELYCSIGNDTINVWYYNAALSGIPADSSITCKFIIIPQQ